jgi:hypothetical protein
MGRQQIYKGDPSLKQYYLVNDFTGGINNTSVDERTADNEFRELLNVELDKKGMLQNRKGWGQLTLLNELIDEKDLHLPYYNPGADSLVFTGDYALIKVVRNDGNVLRVLKNYQEQGLPLSVFLDLDYAYRLEVLMIYETTSGIKLGLLTLSNDTDLDDFEEIATLAVGQFDNTKPLTNIETIEYTDFLYFSLSQFKDTLIGFGEYNIATKTYRIVRDDETATAFIYKPSPFEVSKVGFNILSKNPLTDIRKQEGFIGIQGAFLTQFEVNNSGQLVDTETPILNIPPDGKFTINAIFSGTGISLENFTLEFFTMDNSTDIPNTVTGEYVDNVTFTISDVAVIPSTDKFYIATNNGQSYIWDGAKFVVARFKEKPITAENVVVASKLDDSGIARFACSLPFKNIPEINIRIKLVSGILLSQVVVTSSNTFATTTAMVANFNPTTNTKFAVARSSTIFDLYNKLAAVYQYELMPFYTYSSVNYSPIYNDLNLTTTPKWVNSTESEYNATANRETYQTSTFAEYDAMVNTNVPVAALSKVDNFILRVNRSRWIEGTSSTTAQWVQVGAQSATTVTVGDGTSCTVFNNVTSANASTYLGAAINVPNGTVRKITSSVTTPAVKSFATTFNTSFTATINYISSSSSCGVSGLTALQMANEEASANSYATGTIIRVVEYTNDFAICTPVVGYVTVTETSGSTTSCGEKYYQSVYSTTTSGGYFETSSTFKYYKKITEIVGITGAILSYNPSVGKLYYRSGATKTEIASGIVEIPTIAVKIPNQTEVFLAGTAGVEANYYRYNGGTAGTIADFTAVTFSDSTFEVEYNDIYPIGTNPDAEPIEQLQTKGFRLLEIGSRMVLYRENVIWFSDLYQFDYIPNYNYIILPLTPDDAITNISYFKGSYMIFTKERIYKMSGTFGGQDFQIQIVSDAIGCISPYSVKPFNNTLVFMTRDGLYRIKQNYYLGGLENVEKIDKQVGDIVPTNVEVYSALHNEQYFLFYKYPTTQFGVAPFNVVKMYYNMDAPQGYPFVKDKYSVQPNIIATLDDEFISISNGLFYMYDIGYTDFIPIGILTSAEQDVYRYNTLIRTSNLFFYYPTHDKKFKSILVKTNCNDVVPLYFNIWVDNKLVYSSQDFVVTREGTGTLTYNAVDVASLELQPGDELDLNLTGVVVGNVGALGQLDLGTDKLGDTSTQTHKIVFAAKGKNITVEVRQRLDKYFGIQDIGYVYKMGKAREDR